jgi:hypothetical protein
VEVASLISLYYCQEHNYVSFRKENNPMIVEVASLIFL